VTRSLLTSTLVLSALLCAVSSSSAQPTTRRAKKQAERVARVKRDALEGGDHWHVVAAKGSVHVWRPPGYRRKSAGIVLYVHGYHITGDQSWTIHHLAEQFKASRQNALFLVVDGPTSREDKVRFPDLSRLLQTVGQATRLTLPRGHVVAIGHSGGFRTLVEWLSYKWLDHLILLDALYANEKVFEAWLTTAEKASWHRMFLVGNDTRAKCEAFLKEVKIGRKRKQIPLEPSGFTRRERGERLLYLDSQYEHTQIVSGRKVIPLLLRLTRLKRL
jgi:hypothetical protein